MLDLRRSFILLLSAILFTEGALAQTFSFSSVGERDLESREITAENKVTKYFGLNISGAGEPKLRINHLKTSADKQLDLRLSSSQLTSFLFSGELVEDLSIAFRRGVLATIRVDLIGSDGVISDSREVIIDITKSKKSCKMFPSKTLKNCKKLDLQKASLKNQRRFVKALAKSFRSPIVLEP